MAKSENKVDLRFDGSIWANLDIALRNVDQIFRHVINPLNLTVIEWYILRALYENDGQHASELAKAVGRAATSFTPNLDKLQEKDLIERRPDPGDRRAVRIYLTETAQDKRQQITDIAEMIDDKIAANFSASDYKKFLSVVSRLQETSIEY